MTIPSGGPASVPQDSDPYTAVAPDTKDWTWVLVQPCPECGFDASGVDLAEVARQVRAGVPRWRGALARPDARVRPEPGTWSVLEYAAHARDVNLVFAGRLAAMLADDGAQFASWDQDEAALAARYDLQDPAVVADELAASAAVIAEAFAGVPEELEGNSGLRSNGSTFTVRTLAQYFLHDQLHHLHDVDA